MSNSWSYCIAREQVGGESLYTVRELYTDADGGLSWTGPITPQGDTRADLMATLNRMSMCFTVPMLDLTSKPPKLVHLTVSGRFRRGAK